MDNLNINFSTKKSQKYDKPDKEDKPVKEVKEDKEDKKDKKDKEDKEDKTDKKEITIQSNDLTPSNENKEGGGEKTEGKRSKLHLLFDDEVSFDK